MPEPAPQISVIVPHLNQPEALADCLASLQQQNFPSEAFEVIVIDNGSTPSPGDIVTQYPGVTLLEEINPGPGPTARVEVGHKIIASIVARAIRIVICRPQLFVTISLVAAISLIVAISLREMQLANKASSRGARRLLFLPAGCHHKSSMQLPRRRG